MSALWMLVAAALFSVMGAMVKFAIQQYGVLEVVFYRSLIGVVVIYAFVRWRRTTLATPVAREHLTRGAVGTAALSLWFYATGALPLGTAMTLNYTSPLFLAALAAGVAMRTGERIDWRLVAAILVGFVGIVLLLQPTYSSEQALAAAAGLVSGVLSAVAYWYVRTLGQLGEPEWRTVFYFALSGTVIGFIGTAVQGFSPHDARGVALLVGVGITATLAQLAMTRAYAYGHTLVVANLQFVAVVAASLLGIAVFGDHIPLTGWIGIAIIILSGAMSTVLIARQRGLPTEPKPRSPT
ncbi:MAG TPA: DMT family transporter [Burkholderiaceae bacterium]|nr:DMT family transporter [Burkholderiaceae bacterium]HQR72092.1 DMT family transporter [Burkholderiaceae bacterium]